MQGNSGETPSGKGWYSRGYLPHFDHAGLVQMITFRLADALPVRLLRNQHEALPNEKDAAHRRWIEQHLDAGYGECHLRNPRIGRVVEDALLHFDGDRYRLLAWVVMPNHVHVLIETLLGRPLPEVVQAWKSFSAREANKLLGRSGTFWQPEYFDRYIRDADHFDSAVGYIHGNPVKAGLVPHAEDWPFSSAAKR